MIFRLRCRMKNKLLRIKDTTLIDVHTHGIGIMLTHLLSGHYPYSQDILDLSNKAKENSVDYVVTFPMPTSVYYDVKGIRHRKYFRAGNCDYPFQYENISLLKSIEEFQLDNILPFLGFSTHSKIEEQIKLLVDLIEKHDVWGLKYHATIERKSVMSNQFKEFSKIADEFNIPILVHTKLDEWADPLHLLSFLDENPTIRLCAAHCGHFSRVFFERLKTHIPENLFIDCSPFVRICYDMSLRDDKSNILNIDYSNPLTAFNQLFDVIPYNLLWGTDAPFNSFVRPDGTITTYKDEVNIISSQNIRKQLCQNTIRFLDGKK